MNRYGKHRGARIFGIIILGIGAIFLVTYLVMLLWNAIVPDIFNVGTIGYWQTMGLLVLAKIFFGFGGGGSKSKRRHWRRDIPQEHWAAMTTEEKEKFRQEWRTRCGGWYDRKSHAQPQPQQQPPPASETGTQSA
jgi:Ca2+/H+ antiporter, TMEM165/GDT1 family